VRRWCKPAQTGSSVAIFVYQIQQDISLSSRCSQLLRNSRHCICMQRLLLGLALALVALAATAATAATAASAPPDAFDPATANLDKDQLAQSIRSNTKAAVRASQMIAPAASCHCSSDGPSIPYSIFLVSFHRAIRRAKPS
jgi:hypothetical protein